MNPGRPADSRPAPHRMDSISLYSRFGILNRFPYRFEYVSSHPLPYVRVLSSAHKVRCRVLQNTTLQENAFACGHKNMLYIVIEAPIM